MKHLKHLFAAVIASAMALMIAIPAFAAVDGSISVTGLAAGDQISYYRVIEWKNGGWAITSDFASLTAAKDANDDLLFDFNDDGTATLDEVLLCLVGDGTTTNPGGISMEEASAIANLATAGNKTGTGVVADGETSWTLASPGAGLYMVLIAANQPGIVYNPAFVGADYDAQDGTNSIAITAKYSDTSVAKKTDITVEKTAEDSDGAIAEAIDSMKGDVVKFHINTLIPVFLDSYKAPTFKITDQVTTGITINPNSIALTFKDLSDNEITVPTSAYTLDKTTPANGFTITFDSDWLSSNVAPVKVNVYYEGTVTNAAAYNVNRDDNTVTVDYSNGPNSEAGALKDETRHYTFSLGANLLGTTGEKLITYELFKVAVDGKDGGYVVDKVKVSELDKAPEVGALAGAGFTLYSDEACTNVVGTCTTGANGVLTFEGLAAGTYYLKETTVPFGYNGDTTVHTVVITPTYEVVTVDPVAAEDNSGVALAGYTYKQLASYTVTVDNTNASSYTLTNNGPTSIIEQTDAEIHGTDIENTPGITLPSTGGIGTTIFYVVGGAMVLCGIVMFITKRRIAQIEE